jgi:hypothetical protein
VPSDLFIDKEETAPVEQQNQQLLMDSCAFFCDSCPRGTAWERV